MATALQIDILKQVYRHWVLYDDAIPRDKITSIVPKSMLNDELKLLEISGLLENLNGKYKITSAGRSKFRVVLTGGVYDLIHRGHLITLQEAANYGDFLIVVVARDITVRTRKREPIHSDIDRAYLLNSLCVVDAAIPGDEVDHMRVVRRIKPDVIALGADQFHIVSELKLQIEDQGFPDTKIIRLKADYEGLATSKLIEKIINRVE